MKSYRIILHGCDDVTRITHGLSDAEYALLSALADKFHVASEYQCQPVLEIEEVSP